MPQAHVRLTQPLPEDLADELAKRVFFVSDLIDGFELVRCNGAVEGIALDVAALSEGLDASETLQSIEDKINQLVASELVGQRPLPPKVVWRSAATTSTFVDAFPSLVERGAAFQAAEGQVALGEPLLSLIDHLDQRLRAVALGFEGAREYRYPTLLPTEVLDRFAYFRSFPQFVMFVTRLHNDLDVYERFLQQYEAGGGVPRELFELCGNTDYCLPPTMCYHSYHQFTSAQLHGDTALTARGKSFRFESKYHTNLERLWDFTIRELVFMGTPKYAEQCRASVMEQAFALMDELGLSGACEVASDPFFASADTAGKVMAQRVMELKYELLLDVAPGRRIATASFNLHGSFFGEAFGITRPDGEPAFSGCVGFGLERLVHAFVCQHGVEPANWPAAVRREIG